MFKQSPRRNGRNGELKVKHVLQISLLLGLGIWLLFELQQSFGSKSGVEITNTSSKIERDQIIKLGRKDPGAGIESEEENLHSGEESKQEDGGGEQEERIGGNAVEGLNEGGDKREDLVTGKTEGSGDDRQIDIENTTDANSEGRREDGGNGEGEKQEKESVESEEGKEEKAENGETQGGEWDSGLKGNEEKENEGKEGNSKDGESAGKMKEEDNNLVSNGENESREKNGEETESQNKGKPNEESMVESEKQEKEEKEGEALQVNPTEVIEKEVPDEKNDGVTKEQEENSKVENKNTDSVEKPNSSESEGEVKAEETNEVVKEENSVEGHTIEAAEKEKPENETVLKEQSGDTASSNEISRASTDRTESGLTEEQALDTHSEASSGNEGISSELLKSESDQETDEKTGSFNDSTGNDSSQTQLETTSDPTENNQTDSSTAIPEQEKDIHAVTEISESGTAAN